MSQICWESTAPELECQDGSSRAYKGLLPFTPFRLPLRAPSASEIVVLYNCCNSYPCPRHRFRYEPLPEVKQRIDSVLGGSPLI